MTDSLANKNPGLLACLSARMRTAVVMHNNRVGISSESTAWRASHFFHFLFHKTYSC
jgi:hypothetical protein